MHWGYTASHLLPQKTGKDGGNVPSLRRIMGMLDVYVKREIRLS